MIPVVFALIYGAIRLFSWIIGARLLSSLLNVSIYGGIVGAAYGGDDVYALTGVARTPPYLTGVREQRVAAATLGGIDDNAIIEAAREFYSEIVAEEVAEMTFADPDLLMKRMTDALYHNAYMRDGDIVEAVADASGGELPQLAALVDQPPAICGRIWTSKSAAIGSSSASW